MKLITDSFLSSFSKLLSQSEANKFGNENVNLYLFLQSFGVIIQKPASLSHFMETL